MKNSRAKWRYARLTYGLIVLLWVAYTLSLFLAKSDNQYHLGFGAINVIRVTFALPILLIWLSATVAAVRFKAYANLIKGSPEALGFNRIASGLFFLAGYLVTLLLLGRIAPLFAGTSYLYPVIFIKNHLPVYLLIISFIQLYRGAVHLADLGRAKPTRRSLLITGLSFLVFTTLFVAVFFSDNSNPQTLSGGIPAFAEPHTVLLFSLVLPSLIAWMMGILAAVFLRAYIVRVKGRIYKDLLRQLLVGIYATTTFTILTELLTLNASHLQHLGLNAVLIIVYLFLVAYAIGAVFVGRSASKLTLIEVAS